MTAAMAELVGRAQQGDTEAYGLIYQQYRGMIYRQIYIRVFRNHATAEDLTHDVFIRAIRSIHHFQWQGSDFGAWLATIARNIVIDHHKSPKQNRTVPLAHWNQLAEERELYDASPEGDPEGTAITRIRHAHARAAFDDLTDDQRQCLTLRFVDERTVTETAEAMGRNPQAVKSLTLRALRTIRRNTPGAA